MKRIAWAIAVITAGVALAVLLASPFVALGWWLASR